MPTPWLDIPLADYELHMALPHVGQAKLIADQLGALLVAHRPSSVAIVGCAGGNGFDRFAGTAVERVVGVDVNPRYIAVARERYASCVPKLELVAADIQSEATLFAPVDLIYAALLFEYLQPAHAMRALRRHCRSNGVLATLVQLPHDTVSAVSPSPYVSLQALEPVVQLMSADALRAHAEEVGFTQEASAIVMSPGGKEFALQTFRA